MSKLPSIGNNMSLTEKAYIVIKNAILTNKMKPREILSEEALANDLGISRTPVRSALKKLEFERLIVINSSRNALVADISKEDICKVFPIRHALEPLAAKFAAKNSTSEEIAILEEILDAQKHALKSEDYSLYLQKDYEFHTSLANFSKNEMLKDMVETINTQVKRFLILSVTLQENSFTALEEHLYVLEAIKLSDLAKAEEKMKIHVENVSKRILVNNANYTNKGGELIL